MKERPILFSAPMVCALLAGRKTQTRRIMKAQPYTLRVEGFGYPTRAGGFVSVDSPHCISECPHGKPGDRLWVRENFQPLLAEGVNWRDADYQNGEGYSINYVATGGVREFVDCANDDKICSRITPCIFMPRWASRITLDVTEVRVQRLQEISEADCMAEGIIKLPASGRYVSSKGAQYFGGATSTARGAFCDLWRAINGDGSWDANPWVWAVSFSKFLQSNP